MSAARKLKSISEPKPRLKRQRNLKSKRRLKTKRVISYVKFDTKRYKTPRVIIITIGLIFASGVGTTFAYASLQDLTHQIERQRVALQRQQENNIAVRAEITRFLSVEEVERIAVERLNMGRPDPSQVVLINVPRPSYVVQSEASGTLANENMWQSAMQHIRNWLGV